MGVCFFSSFFCFFLFRTIYVRYLMEFWCMSFMRVLMVIFGIFRCVSFLMECSCMAPLTPTMMVISGLVCHPLICISSMRESYLVCLYVRLSPYLKLWNINIFFHHKFD